MVDDTQVPIPELTPKRDRVAYPDGSYTEIVRGNNNNNSWGHKTFDPQGREIHYESKGGYWSRHTWTDHIDGSYIDSYYNCKGVWHRRMYDVKHQLLWEDNESGLWITIVSTSHRVLHNTERALFRVGSTLYNHEALLVHLEKQKHLVCPTVFAAITKATTPVVATGATKLSKFTAFIISMIRRIYGLGPSSV